MMKIWCFATIAALVALVYNEGVSSPERFEEVVPKLTNFVNWTLPTQESFKLYGAYIVFLALLGPILPKDRRPGTLLKDKTRLTYNCNGLFVYITLLVTYVGLVKGEYIKGTIIYDNFGPLLGTANAIAIALSVYLYVMPQFFGTAQNTGNPAMDFVMGVELNPFVAGLNIKFFWLRPSMMMWSLINLSFLYKQYELYQTLSVPMILYQVFTFVYVFDYFWFEHFMTSTWDIIAENFGLMLVWGDFVFIPYFFSLQNWYLLEIDPTPMPMEMVAVCVVVFITGYVVFRGANYQKHQFKHNPTEKIWGKKPKPIAGKLLAQGFWGYARHMNYFGDITLAISYSLPCMLASPVAYAYPVYLIILLLHREWRDEAKCKKKYGTDWVLYCKRVPYRIVPFVY